ncbi:MULTISPECIES: lipase family protein [Nocardia]|uniref:lipase family protein n=1 Tax=Nocardia TaxID=1817 RepID=UPI0018938171|nr:MULTISPECIES: lipase family protein [Nocardia]MBF6349071.1 alpha/beta hydrolase [Nocardia flavorosea]
MRTVLSRRGTAKWRAAIVLAATALIATACGDGSDQAASATPGALITATPVRVSPDSVIPEDARTERITYLSQSAAGRQILVSGTVTVPAGEPPEGGWPVISWAHGTTGVGDACAPSAHSVGGPARDYLAVTDPVIARWVSAGYAVAATDYEGLGTPGEHPYMNGVSAAHTVTDIVRAARGLDSRIGAKWAVAGHSQGGHAALFTAAQGAEYAPELDLVGAVSYAPGSRTSDTAAYMAAGGPGVRAAIPFLPVLLLGAEAADPALSAENMISDAARPLLDAARTGCMDQIKAASARIPADDLFAPGADTAALTAYFAGQEPEGLHLTVPALVAQGTDDALVGAPITTQITEKLCAGGSVVDYRTYEGADHRAVLTAAADDVDAFLRTLFAGEQPGATCGT